MKGVIRHVQLKASYIGGKTSRQKIHIKLAEKPSGCVIWVYFNEETLDLGPLYFFGGIHGEALPILEGTKIARHTKGDQDGYKAERLNIRELNESEFIHFESVEAVYNAIIETKE